MTVMEDLPNFGAQLSKYSFKNAADWWISLTDPRKIFLVQPTFAIEEIVFYIITLFTIIHAFCVGARWKTIWFSTLLTFGICCCISTAAPEYKIVFPAQSAIMLFGREFCLHHLLGQSNMVYTAFYTASHLNSCLFVNAFAASFAVLMAVLPGGVVSQRFLHITFHNSDLQTTTQVFGFPLISLVYAALTTFTIGITNYFFRNLLKANAKTGLLKELLITILSVISSIILVFILLGLYTFIKPRDQQLFVAAVAILIAIYVWVKDRAPKSVARRGTADESHWSVWLLAFCLFLQFANLLGMVAFGQPDRQAAMGLHQTTGPCQETETVTCYATTYERKKYMCVSDLASPNFDFHCLKSPPKDGMSWYTLCGTPFDDRMNYIFVVCVFLIVNVVVFRELMFKSLPILRTYQAKGGRFPADKKVKKR